MKTISIIAALVSVVVTATPAIADQATFGVTLPNSGTCPSSASVYYPATTLGALPAGSVVTNVVFYPSNTCDPVTDVCGLTQFRVSSVNIRHGGVAQTTTGATSSFNNMDASGLWESEFLLGTWDCSATVKWSFVVTYTPPPPPPTPQATVRGSKFDQSNRAFTLQQIYVDGNAATQTNNNYTFDVINPNGRSLWVTSSFPDGGWSIWSSTIKCGGAVNCDQPHADSTYIPGGSLVTFNTNDLWSVWFRYYEPVIGNLDTVTSTDGNFGGWAFDPGAPSTSIPVDIYIDGVAGSGVPSYRVITSGSRPDVNSAYSQYGLTGNHGWNFSLPASYLDGRNHTIHIYAIAQFRQPNNEITASPGTYVAPAPPPVCPSGYRDCGGGTCVKVGLICP